MRTLTPEVARRLAISRQHLAGPPAAVDREGIVGLIRELGCLQLDPIQVVARTHELVLWSRLGAYDRGDLAALRWEERRLFEYWAHAASIVLTEDYPIHNLFMRTYPRGTSVHRRRATVWLAENRALRRHVMSSLRRSGPLRLRDIEDRSVAGWRTSGWNDERNVNRMLDILQTMGVVVVAGRTANEKLWDLAERWFPDSTPRERLSQAEVVRRAAQRSLRALGVARPKHIERHFTAGRYPGLDRVLPELQRRGTIEQVRIADDGQEVPGPWFVHAQDLPLVERLEAGAWEPRTTLLSPFDNLIIDRDRTELLFGFRFRMEIYVPKEKREYGYYVLPILHGDRLIGRIDPIMDRRQRRLVVNAVHAEPGVPASASVGRSVARAVRTLAAFLGAASVDYGSKVPAPWKRALR